MSEWTAALTGFRRHLESAGLAQPTAEGYLKHVGWLAESIETGPWELAAPELAAWLDARNWSQGTRRKVLVSFRTFYAWAVAEQLVEWAPTAGLPSSAPRKRGPAPRRLPDAWASVVEEYVTWSKSASRGDGTIALRTFWLGRLAEVSADPWAVTTAQLARWLSNPDWSAETKRAARSSARTFYRWAVKAGHIAVSPAEDLEPVLLPRALPKPAPDDAIREALREANDLERLALMLAAHAGLRRAEIAMLHTSQIGQTEILVVGKAGHHRRVPLHPDLARELHVELDRRRRGRAGSGFPSNASATGWFFPSRATPGAPLTPHHLGKLMSRCLPEDWTAHNLRHRFATAAYGIERDLRTVQELLGHAKPETTARYAAVPDGAKRAAVFAIGL